MAFKKVRVKRLKEAMASAKRYEEWLGNALTLDELEGNMEWRRKRESPRYDADLLEAQMELMRVYRADGRVLDLLRLLHESMHRNLGDFHSPGLYRKAWSGSKFIIEEYLNEIIRSLNFLVDGDFEGLTNEKKLEYLLQTDKNFGRSALVLSGGATMGVFHLGVVKALWEQDLLPNIISGSSMGAFVAAVLGTHTPEELRAFFRSPIRSQTTDYFKWNAFGDIKDKKALLDSETMHELFRMHVKDYTFAEAFERTGRIININVSPTRAHQKPRVLNYLTAPDLLISQSVLASCAVPGLFPPVVLKRKTALGETVPYIPEEKWIDGSMVNDVPLRRLTRLHNANHFIVSQTNPHVVPFINARRKPGLVPLVLDLAGSMVFNQSVGLLDVTRRRVHSYPARPMLDWVYSFASQQYSGDINIRSSFAARDYLKVFRILNEGDIDEFIRAGELATYPKIAKIRNQTMVSRAFCQAIRKLRGCVHNADDIIRNEASRHFSI